LPQPLQGHNGQYISGSKLTYNHGVELNEQGDIAQEI
jgi:hypothetical protein